LFFELDRTLVRPKYLLHNLYPEEQTNILDEFQKQEMFDGTSSEFTNFKNYIQSTQDYFSPNFIGDETFVEPSSLSLIKRLSESGAIIMGLTARHFLISDITHQSLKNLGIDFEKLSGFEANACSAEGRPNGLKKGIYYTGNQLSKVACLQTLTRLIKSKLKKNGPFKIYHFDDNPGEIDAFYAPNIPLTDLDADICVQPYFYTGHDKFMDNLDKNALFQEIDEEFYYNFFKKLNLQQ